MFKFEIGQRVKVIGDGIRRGTIALIEEREMSSGTIQIPRYYIKGFWYYENELKAC